MAQLTYGQANSRIILTADKMGYPVSSLAKEQAIMIDQGDSIDPIYMGMLDSEAGSLHNAIAQDGRVDEAILLASS